MPASLSLAFGEAGFSTRMWQEKAGTCCWCPALLIRECRASRRLRDVSVLLREHQPDRVLACTRSNSTAAVHRTTGRSNTRLKIYAMIQVYGSCCTGRCSASFFLSVPSPLYATTASFLFG